MKRRKCSLLNLSVCSRGLKIEKKKKGRGQGKTLSMKPVLNVPSNPHEKIIEESVGHST